MNCRDQWIQKLFSKLQNLPYVLLKHIGQMDDHSDIDLLLSKQETQKVIAQVIQDQEIAKHQILKQSSMWQLMLYFEDHTFLQVDFLFGFFRKEWCYLSAEAVQKAAIQDAQGWRICALPYLAEHLLWFNVLNHAAVPQKYLDYFAQQNEEQQEHINQHLQQRLKLPDFDWRQCGTYDPEFRKYLMTLLQQNAENNFLQLQKRRLIYYWDSWQKMVSARGMSISFSGVDGAGKSTIIEEVKNTLTQKYRRRVVVLRHRPSLIPILSAFRHGKAAAENQAATRLPRQGNNENTWSSLLRFTYYYSDYLIGQFYVFFRYHLRSYIVLYDRYYFDFIVDSRRSNICLNEQLPRFLYRFIHKPQLNLFLYARPEVIRQRKQELPVEDIKDLTQRYRQLFDNLSQERNPSKEYYLAIENEKKEKTLHTILEHYQLLQV